MCGFLMRIILIVAQDILRNTNRRENLWYLCYFNNNMKIFIPVILFSEHVWKIKTWVFLFIYCGVGMWTTMNKQMMYDIINRAIC